MKPTEVSQLDEWAQQAQLGKLSWNALAEKILESQHPSSCQHQPDIDRARRCGFGEVIFGSNKSAEAIIQITQRLLDAGQHEVLTTRVTAEQARLIYPAFAHCRYDALGRTLRLSNHTILPNDTVDRNRIKSVAQVTVVTAGSTDLPVAREAIETLRWMRIDASLITDVGVAGPYRLLAHLNHLRQCVAIVVVAGMEGALASVMGGLVSCPVIAVPTSIGYGANFEGITTLLSMLSSCAAGVTVVNIDAGFKGGYIAGLIAARYDQANQPT